MYLAEFPEHLSLYRNSKIWELQFGHFSVFFELRTVFWPFLGTVVENAKHKQLAPGNSLNKNLSIEI